ncbi:MAG: zinc ribbon domain-containing protein, partial [Dolichospermum sp.]|nr:zinc ribbon domain-containing protein [Dolichospermum sp.]
MLICPQCKFENPDSNKFCQSCGTSLAHKICPECSADVALNARFCHKCSAECGPIWWTIITQALPIVVSATAETGELIQNPENENIVNGDNDSSPFLKFAIDSYLDPQQRYRLLESLPTPEVTAANR